MIENTTETKNPVTRTMDVKREGVVTLETLKSRPCSLEELQAALVLLIEIVNLNGQNNTLEFQRVDDALSNKQNREWRATI